MAQAVSLACYAGLYRRVLASPGARLASFLVSHVTPVGSVTGSALNIAALETEGIAPPRPPTRSA